MEMACSHRGHREDKERNFALTALLQNVGGIVPRMPALEDFNLFENSRVGEEAPNDTCSRKF